MEKTTKIRVGNVIDFRREEGSKSPHWSLERENGAPLCNQVSNQSICQAWTVESAGKAFRIPSAVPHCLGSKGWAIVFETKANTHPLAVLGRLMERRNASAIRKVLDIDRLLIQQSISCRTRKKKKIKTDLGEKNIRGEVTDISAFSSEIYVNESPNVRSTSGASPSNPLIPSPKVTAKNTALPHAHTDRQDSKTSARQGYSKAANRSPFSERPFLQFFSFHLEAKAGNEQLST
ncbi:hypothetical protein CEXT_72671 [Caerostris extrusa]|uniref:Uncharacterized protein n=1 Tax=Caerostris extrusa TaxID=172846 RepID=A0AAV4NFG6_CAEEX|nr:hypothetical protein CEXT_72671 [Caerostris extrusa]